MSIIQMIITIAVIILGTVLTRFLPYLLFPAGKELPPVVQYLGKVLAPAVFGLLVIYCLRNVEWTGGLFGLPEIIALLVVGVSFVWKKQMMLSMAAGTAVYMVLVQLVF